MLSFTGKPKIGTYLKIARLDHWIKQLFILPGFVFAVQLLHIPLTMQLILPLATGLLSTCFVASANYVINEWLDADFDRFHPVKKLRPLVSEALKPKFILLEYALLAALGLLLAALTSAPVLIMEACLLLMGVVYNVRPMRTKEIPYVDVLSESLNNAIRLLIGWFIVAGNYLPPASIVLGYWMSGAYLMAIKRYSEYRMINDRETASLYRKSFARYTEKSLLVSSFFYALLSVFFCGVFMIKYRIELVLAMPFFCWMYCYYLYISFKTDSAAQKPEKLYREKGLMLSVLVFIVIVCVLMVVDIPALNLIDHTILIEVGK